MRKSPSPLPPPRAKPPALGMLVCGHLRSVIEGTTWGGVEGRQRRACHACYIETDEYGNTIIERRPASTNLTLTANCTTEMADAALSRLRRLLDVPAYGWPTTSANFSGLVAFGLASGRVTYGPAPQSCKSPSRTVLTMSVVTAHHPAISDAPAPGDADFNTKAMTG